MFQTEFTAALLTLFLPCGCDALVAEGEGDASSPQLSIHQPVTAAGRRGHFLRRGVAATFCRRTAP